MCGIFALLARNYGQRYDRKVLIENLNKIKERGPDNTQLLDINSNLFFGFHRLSIMDLSCNGNQPMILNNNLFLICNGEIYNHQFLENKYNFKCHSKSDCEIILHLYQYGFNINEIASMLDGVFAFCLYDKSKNILFAARDPIGVRPLFIGYSNNDNNDIFFASESKAFIYYTNNLIQFPPGCSWSSLSPKNFNKWYFVENILDVTNINCIKEESVACDLIYKYFYEAVKKRLMSDRKIATFLSGGLDSSLVTSLVNKLNKYTVNTYSIGMVGSTDLIYAQKVADYIKSNHHPVLFTIEEGIAAIEEVIQSLETFDITTIRASIGMHLLSKYIKKNSDDIVIYSGEGADELCQGYLYFHNAPNAIEGAINGKKLMDNLHFFDVKRVDRCVSNHGLEVRVPFLDKDFMKLYLSIDPKLRSPLYKRCEKYLIRKAFDGKNYLPKEVLWRTKEAFSDGVSSIQVPWYKILQNHIETIISDKEFLDACNYYRKEKKIVPITKEALYYRKIYNKYYGKCELIPYYWMPEWSNTNDPSARTISKFHELNTKEEKVTNDTTSKL